MSSDSQAVSVPGTTSPFIVASAPMAALIEAADRAALSDGKVLITGESGVGKDLIARRIHARSRRTHHPFVPVNCAGLTESLLESELFGHVKGSFTGAYRDKPGKLQAAHRGTIFLDEVGEMSLRMQAMLLRFLENGEIQAVGSDARPSIVDVRVVAATNRNLPELISAGQFREDLLYRLRVIHIEVPPLRERRDDIRPLAMHFAERTGRPCRFTPAAMEVLSNYSWPGNIRELENVVERAVLFCDAQKVRVEDLPPEVRGGPAVPLSVPPPDANLEAALAGEGGLKEHVKVAMSKLERELVSRALSQTNGNVTHAARLLKISRKGLQLKMKELGLREASDKSE